MISLTIMSLITVVTQINSVPILMTVMRSSDFVVISIKLCDSGNCLHADKYSSISFTEPFSFLILNSLLTFLSVASYSTRTTLPNL